MLTARDLGRIAGQCDFWMPRHVIDNMVERVNAEIETEIKRAKTGQE